MLLAPNTIALLDLTSETANDFKGSIPNNITKDNNNDIDFLNLAGFIIYNNSSFVYFPASILLTY